MDLLDLGTKALSYRRCLNLIKHLPRDSATACAMVGPVPEWADNEYLLARVADSVAHLGWMYARVHGKNVPGKPPEPIRRPGDRGRHGMTVSVNQRERATYAGGSLTIEELREVVAVQTGAPLGIASGVD